MMFQNGLCHMIGGTPLHPYTSEVDFERARQNLALFRIAWFEKFNASCGAMLRSLGVPVVVTDRTNPLGAGYPPSHLDHAENFGAPDDIVELVQSMNQEDIRLYRAAIELHGTS